MRHFLFSLSILGLLAACSPESHTLQARRDLPAPAAPVIPHYDPIAADKIEWITLDGGQSQFDFNPRVDILFVIDNSDSMKSAEDNLTRNIYRFVDTFQKNKMIDYHIGVTSVWDSSDRFAKTKKNSYSDGELWNVKNKNGQILNQKFVSRADNINDVLASTINIGIAPYAEGGPENEEMFSPIEGALVKAGHGGANEGFFRDDAQLVTVILSDADDSTDGVTPEQVAQQLFDFKKGDRKKVSAYAALVKKSDPDESKDWGLRVHPKYHPECFDSKGRRNDQCPDGFGPDRLEQFIVSANAEQGSPAAIRASHIMSLIQKDFGQDLAKIGSDITAKTLAKEILLDQRPRQSADGTLMIRVRYGTPDVLSQGKGQIIPQQQKGGWVFNADNNSIQLSGDVQYVYQVGGRFAVDMVPVTTRTK